MTTSPPFDCKDWITPALSAGEASFFNLTITAISRRSSVLAFLSPCSRSSSSCHAHDETHSLRLWQGPVSVRTLQKACSSADYLDSDLPFLLDMVLNIRLNGLNRMRGAMLNLLNDTGVIAHDLGVSIGHDRVAKR